MRPAVAAVSVAVAAASPRSTARTICSRTTNCHDQLSCCSTSRSDSTSTSLAPVPNRFLSRMPGRSLIDGAARFQPPPPPLADRQSAEGKCARRAADPADTKLREGRTPRSDCDCRIRHRSTALTGRARHCRWRGTHPTAEQCQTAIIATARTVSGGCTGRGFRHRSAESAGRIPPLATRPRRRR